MIEVKNITGWQKVLFNLRLKVTILIHFIPELLKLRITPGRFALFLKRLLVFLARMQHNKFVNIGGRTRLGLYIPGFPSEAFYTACKKFSEFEGKMPCTTVLISITSACPYNCLHCYQKLDKGRDLDLDSLLAVTKKLQDMGIAFFNIEGGEPFLVYERLKMICSAIDERSEIWINSTGAGMTIERLLELKQMNVTAIMFSLHSHDPGIFNKFLGQDSAWDTMLNGVSLCHEAGLPVAFNTCLMRDDFYNGNFERIMEKAKELKACCIQVIKPKQAGGWLDNRGITFTQEDLLHAKSKVQKYNLQDKYSHYPAISAQIIEEDKRVFGCTAGGIDRFYVNAKGDLQPCEFLNISFGNIGKEKFEEIYEKMRGVFAWGGDCHLCEKNAERIHEIFKENTLSSLPLSPELSQQLYSAWDRGSPTELYEKLENMKC